GATILQHPDVRRMLMSMRAATEAMRAIAYVTAAALDNASAHPDPEARKRHQAFADLMIPIVKGWCTETAQEIAYTGVQVHGGMGFIEETGAAQHYRDARIITIYEGTTAIQANDLIGRKTARDGGKTALAVIAEMQKLDDELGKQSGAEFAAIRCRAAAHRAALSTGTRRRCQGRINSSDPDRSIHVINCDTAPSGHARCTCLRLACGARKSRLARCRRSVAAGTICRRLQQRR